MLTLFVTLCCLLGTSWAGSSMGELPSQVLPDDAQAGATAAPSVPREQLHKIPVTGEGIGSDRSAYVWIPKGKGPFPVVFAIHGGKRRDGRDMVAKMKLAEKRGIMLVYPNGGEVPRGRGWVGPDKKDGIAPDRDIRYFRALLHVLEQQGFPIDKDRMFVTGMSGGGYMANLLWCEMSDTFAGFGVVSRAMPKVMAQTCDVAQPRPYLLMLGTADDGVSNQYQLPLDETRAFVRTQLGCAETPELDRTLPDKGDRLQVNHKRFACSAGVHFDDYEIVGGGHAWPGTGKSKPDKAEDVDATEVILKAFGL